VVTTIRQSRGQYGLDSLEAFESIKGYVLLVGCPRNVLCLQKIHNRGDASGGLVSMNGCNGSGRDTLWWDVI
jgi:hypothetical protein